MGSLQELNGLLEKLQGLSVEKRKNGEYFVSLRGGNAGTISIERNQPKPRMTIILWADNVPKVISGSELSNKDKKSMKEVVLKWIKTQGWEEVYGNRVFVGR